MKRPYGPCLTCKTWVPMLRWSTWYNKTRTTLHYRGNCECGMILSAEGTIDEPPQPPELEVVSSVRRTTPLPECPKCEKALFMDEVPFCIACGYEDYGYHAPSKLEWNRRKKKEIWQE